MSKALTNDIMSVLRQFEIAGELTSKQSITLAKELEASRAARLIRFIFEKTKYYIIFDDTADDDAEYLQELVFADDPNAFGAPVKNPHDSDATYGLRYKSKEVYLFAVKPTKLRLDIELSNRYEHLSRSTIQKYIKAGYVSVNGEVITQVRSEVSTTAEIAMTPPDPTDFSLSELPILYIDDNVIVVNKPVGVLTHSKGAMNDEFTVADFFRRYTTNALETSRPGVVHRLDRDTSGVIIGARNDETALMLKKQFADRKTKKEYLAVVDGVPKVEHALIDLPIGRNPSAPSTFRVDPAGKEAQTTYEVLASNGTHSLVKLTPKTGRTHQLRVHLQYINTPIIGDRIYGVAKNVDRLYLHARQLEITIPVSKRTVFSAPVPDEFIKRFPGVTLD
ncbi:MAG: RluA family pseudouridine synthase [Candidatus Microsaccharimonas sp.]